MGTEQTLSRCEELIMYCIWEAGGEVTGAQVQSMVNERFQKSYEKTTIWTFLKRLREKGYVDVRKVKNCSYYHATADKKVFVRQQTDDIIDLWFDGAPSKLIAALGEKENLDKEKIAEMRRLLDELDECYTNHD